MKPEKGQLTDKLYGKCMSYGHGFLKKSSTSGGFRCMNIS